MFQGSSETQELRALYNFAEDHLADTNVSGALSAQEFLSTKNYDNDRLVYSPQERQGNGDTLVSLPAIGTIENARAAATFASSVSATDSKKSRDTKSEIVKEVLGKNKKSTKGMTDEEKYAVELEERWKNALLEEQRLNDLEQRVSRAEIITAEVGQFPNFPCKFLCIKPLVYHSFSAVPEHRQLLVKMAFWDWVVLSFLLLFNSVIAITVTFIPPRREIIVLREVNMPLNTVLAVVYLVGIPLSFLIWYWWIYQACLTGRPGDHLLAQVGLLIALAQAIAAFVGPLSYGLCGILLTQWINSTRPHVIVVPLAIMATLWALQAIFICFLFVKMFIFYRKDLAARRRARHHLGNVVG